MYIAELLALAAGLTGIYFAARLVKVGVDRLEHKEKLRTRQEQLNQDLNEEFIEKL